jgi:hypothetical protein
MDRPPSIRWMRVGVTAFCGAGAMIAGAVATGATHGPGALVVVFIVLVLVFALVAFGLIAVGASKSRAENRRLVAQAQERAQAHTRHDHRPRLCTGTDRLGLCFSGHGA